MFDDAFIDDFTGGKPTTTPNKQISNDTTLIETSTNSSDSHGHIIQQLVRTPSSEKRSKRGRKSNSGKEYLPANITYRGLNIYQAAEMGNMPVCVLLWSLASSKRVNLIVSDSHGNNPMHYAATADTPEVVQFLQQQTKNNDEYRLLEARNLAGETPLLRCMLTGNIPVAKVLIDDGSDCLATDNNGASIFTRLAREGHLWCLNFMFNTICNLHGPQVTMELMSSLDAEGKNPLDWAAEAGHINVMEFFIRRGLNPHRLDLMGRTCLSWAVRANKAEAARFLVLCGCDPSLTDAQSTSPLLMATAMKDKELLAALKVVSHVPKHIPTTDIEYGTIQHTDPTNNSSLLYRREGVTMMRNINGNASTTNTTHTTTTNNTNNSQLKSIAIYQRNLQQKRYILGYFVFFAVLWLFAVFFPFYAVIGAYVLIYYGYKRIENFYLKNPGIKSPLQRFIQCKERGLGLWCACIAVYAVYLVTSYFQMINNDDNSSINNNNNDTNNDKDSHNEPLEIFHHVDAHNPFHILGTSGSLYARHMYFYVAVFAFLSAVASCLKLLVADANPGIVDNRIQDYEEILAHSFICAGEPARGLYCRTTMVKKPIRGKYCVQTGAVVARMDHYCAWLNLTIGYNNHPSFLLFLFLHLCMVSSGFTLIFVSLYHELYDYHKYTLQQEAFQFSTCAVIEKIVSRWYFFVIVLGVVMLVATVLFGLLFYDQCINVATNWTTNERINLTRYPWIMQQSDGSYSTRFDRGVFTNLCEFFRIPTFTIDYRNLFIMPAELTQENMRLNYNNINVHHNHINSNNNINTNTNTNINNNHHNNSSSSHYSLNHFRLNNIHSTVLYAGPNSSFSSSANHNHHNHHNSHHHHPSSQFSSGPPSVDLEMTNNTNNNSNSSSYNNNSYNNYHYSIHHHMLHNNHNHNNNNNNNNNILAMTMIGTKPRADSMDSSDTSNNGTET